MRLMAITDWYTSGDLTGISIVNSMFAMLRGAQARQPTFCEWPIPRSKDRLTWDDSLFDLPYVRTHPVAEDWLPFVGEMTPPVRELTLMLRPGKGPILDYVLNQKYFFGADLDLLATTPPGRWYQDIEVPIVNWLTETGLDKRLWLLRQRTGHLLMLTSAMVGPTLVMTELDRDELTRLAHRYLPLTTAERIAASIWIVPPPIDTHRLDEMRPVWDQFREQRNGQFVALHGGSLEGKRQLTKISETLAQLRARNVPVQGLFTTQRDAKADAFGDAVVVRGETGKAGYWAAFGEADISLCATEYEGTGLAYMEAIRAGLLPVVMAFPWIRPRLPHDYPLAVKPNDWGGFANAIKFATEHYDQLQADWRRPLLDAIRPFGEEEVGEAFVTATNEALALTRERNVAKARTFQPGFAVLEAAVAGGAIEQEFVGFGDVYRAMKAHSEKGVDFKYLSPLALRWMLTALGWEDDCSGPDVVMKHSARNIG